MTPSNPMNNSPEGAQGSANSKTPRTDAIATLRLTREIGFSDAWSKMLEHARTLERELIELKWVADNNRPFNEWAQEYLDGGRWAGHHYGDAIKQELIERDSQLAQSEERVKALTEGLDKLTAWGMYCPDWADRNSKAEYAKDFMAALDLLSSSKTN